MCHTAFYIPFSTLAIKAIYPIVLTAIIKSFTKALFYVFAVSWQKYFGPDPLALLQPYRMKGH